MSGRAISVPHSGAQVSIRRATPQDALVCGQICYAAFSRINVDHGFPPDFPSLDVAVDVLSGTFSHPRFFCVVAESDGRILGSNCLDERFEDCRSRTHHG